MHYTIYKITNTINGKYYIGKHQTENPNDSYFGSGKAILSAIKKYGKDSFLKEILFDFNNAKDMDQKEREIVTEDVVKDGMSYNMGVGGEGGPQFRNKKHKSVAKKRISDSVSEFFSKKENRQKVSDAITGDKNSAYGKKWINDGTKNRRIDMNEKPPKGWELGMIGNSFSGESNPQFGTVWITNETENKRLKRNLDIPSGWRKGRVLK